MKKLNLITTLLIGLIVLMGCKKESLDPVVLPIGAVLAVLGYKAIREILHQIGKNVDQEPAELKNYTDLVLDKAKDLDIKVSLTDLKSEIYSKIDSGEIKTAGQILKCFDND
jgi:hypothetical protein